MGNTSATNRFTAIKTRLWIEIVDETSIAKWISLHNTWSRGPPINQDWILMCNRSKSRGNRKIGYSRSDMAMFTMKKLVGFLRVFVLCTINPMRVFATNETTNCRQWAKVSPILCAVRLKQLKIDYVIFIAPVTFVDILRTEGQFLLKLTTLRRLPINFV